MNSVDLDQTAHRSQEDPGHCFRGLEDGNKGQTFSSYLTILFWDNWPINESRIDPRFHL
jgi:hypothetical protein